MDVSLREFRESDLSRLDEWAAAINSGEYMSRYRPRDHFVTAHAPENGILWFVICAQGRDIGTVWLEPDQPPDQATLGIMLGERTVFGRGIGQQAINLALEQARQCGRFTKVILHVRVNNARAIACYEKCSFRTISTGVKLSSSGDEIHYLIMGRAL